MKKTRNSEKPEGILQNIITYICIKSNTLSSTKLMKMVYLVDVYHYTLQNKRATKARFKHHNYGAFAIEVYQVRDELYEKEIIREKVVQTKKGREAIIPESIIPEALIELPKTIFDAVEAVVDDWGHISPDNVVKFTKETLPFLNTPFGEKIDFSRVDPIVEYAKEKGISEEEAATIDVISNKSLLKQINEAEKDLREGNILTHDQVFGSTD